MDVTTYHALQKAVGAKQYKNCLILGDCTFHNGMDLESFRQAISLESVATIDLYGQPTIRADLQGSIPEGYWGKFDLIVDAGTLFCCFDVAQVWRNILLMLTDQGSVFHQAGLTGYFGRTYYSLHPALFRDFYQANGFEIAALAVRANRARSWFGGRDGYQYIAPDDVFMTNSAGGSFRFGGKFTRHFRSIPNDATVICMATRESVAPFQNALPVYYAG